MVVQFLATVRYKKMNKSSNYLWKKKEQVQRGSLEQQSEEILLVGSRNVLVLNIITGR
jgi:phage protein U